jgi:hypothetical protein
MDADHRHELKENDLAEFITHFGEWWQKHGTKLTLIVLVIVAAYAGKRLIDARSSTAMEQAWGDLATSTSPESYQFVAQSHDIPAVRALANLRGADLLLAQVAVPPDDEPNAQAATADAPPNDADPEKALLDAAAMYQRVIDDPSIDLAFKLNAHLGLAAVAESFQQWDQAQQHYNTVLNLAGPAYTAIANRTQTRLGMLDRLDKPVVFAPDPEPAAEPASPPSNPDFAEDLPVILPDSDIDSTPAGVESGAP